MTTIAFRRLASASCVSSVDTSALSPAILDSASAVACSAASLADSASAARLLDRISSRASSCTITSSSRTTIPDTPCALSLSFSFSRDADADAVCACRATASASSHTLLSNAFSRSRSSLVSPRSRSFSSRAFFASSACLAASLVRVVKPARSSCKLACSASALLFSFSSRSAR